MSRNLGEVDHEALLAEGEVFPDRNLKAGFRLYRIGDAVASRNVHAAMYDALRFGIRWSGAGTCTCTCTCTET